MSDASDAIGSMAIEYARLISEINDTEHSLALKKRDCDALNHSISSFEYEHVDAVVLEMTDHGFSQAMNRFERAIMMRPSAYDDVYNEPVHSSILSPSGFKSYIITILASSFQNGNFQPENKSEGLQYRYNININRWKDCGPLEFVAIVKKNKLITGFFNWN